MRQTIPLTTTPRERLALLWGSVTAGMVSPRIAALVFWLARSSQTPREFVERAMGYVQGLAVVPDPRGTEQFQSVLETLDEGGDCEDHSALLVALLESARRVVVGLETIGGRLTWMQLEPIAALNHVTSQATLDRGATWLWAEPSVRGAQLGENPIQAAVRVGDWSAFNAG